MPLAPEVRPVVRPRPGFSKNTSGEIYTRERNIGLQPLARFPLVEVLCIKIRYKLIPVSDLSKWIG